MRGDGKIKTWQFWLIYSGTPNPLWYVPPKTINFFYFAPNYQLKLLGKTFFMKVMESPGGFSQAADPNNDLQEKTN